MPNHSHAIGLFPTCHAEFCPLLHEVRRKDYRVTCIKEEVSFFVSLPTPLEVQQISQKYQSPRSLCREQIFNELRPRENAVCEVIDYVTVGERGLTCRYLLRGLGVMGCQGSRNVGAYGADAIAYIGTRSLFKSVGVAAGVLQNVPQPCGETC